MKNYFLLSLALCCAQISFAQNARSKAEVFVQIPDRGTFTVSLDNESISSVKGRFRFFEVYSASPILSITQGDRRIYSQSLTIKGNERIIYTYDRYQGLKTHKILPIYRNGQYALDDFDQEIAEISPPWAEDRLAHFKELQLAVKKASFDEAKMDVILIGVIRNKLSTAQFSTLLALMNDDDKKLKVAKSAYVAISDPQNFYQTTEAFTFTGRKDELLSFLKIKQLSRTNGALRTIAFEQLLEQIKKESFDDGRTKVIQHALKDIFISTNQVAALLKLYTFEDSKLLMAKLLYYQILDKQNYHNLASVFKFNSAQDSFLDFITNMQN